MNPTSYEQIQIKTGFQVQRNSSEAWTQSNAAGNGIKATAMDMTVTTKTTPGVVQCVKIDIYIYTYCTYIYIYVICI